MSDIGTPSSTDQASYWNGEGGQIWVRNMDRTEANFVSLTPRLLACAAAQPGEQVLDIGCGGGETSRALAQAVSPDGAVLAVDISEPILRVARQRHGTVANLDFLQADAGDRDFGTARFDLLFSRFGVMFFADPVAAFGNLHRSLKPTGRLVFMCWRALDENPWIAAPTQAAIAALGEAYRPAPPADPHAPGPFAFADADHVRDILRHAGFTAVAIDPLDEPLHLGDLHTALDYLKNMGPISQALPKVDADQRHAVDLAMRNALDRYRVDGEVRAPSATWIVTARP
ncbi:MAG: methyltransferase domain-containing protein [Immundisolibacter sp.]